MHLASPMCVFPSYRFLSQNNYRKSKGVYNVGVGLYWDNGKYCKMETTIVYGGL